HGQRDRRRAGLVERPRLLPALARRDRSARGEPPWEGEEVIQEISLTLTPHAGGAALVLPAGELEQDALGNLTVRWVDAVYQGRLLRASDLLGYLSSNVEVHRNRLGTVVAVTDPGGLLLEA